jgi:hypothetical protein
MPPLHCSYKATTVWDKAACAAALCVSAFQTHAQPMYYPTMGQDWGWTYIGQPGNPAYDGRYGPPQASVNTTGRGRVNESFYMQTGQLTIGQWLEFANTIASNPANFALSGQLNLNYRFSPAPPVGILADVNYQGPGTRQFASAPWLLDRPMVLTWREAALIANWLHHDRTNDLALCLSGAYDINSWGGPANDGTVTDDAHLPGARFWIPSLDEWLKAAFWDDNRLGLGQRDWRSFSYGDTGPSSPHWRGMINLGGSGSEFTETAVFFAGQQYAWAVTDTGPHVNFAVAVAPLSTASVRFATSVPTPVSAVGLLGLWALQLHRRRTRTT